MKPAARESFRKELTKTIEAEGIENIDIDSLSDKELKDLYLKLQIVKSRRCYYGVKKGNDFEEDLNNGNLQFVSFSDTYKLGVRPITFKEFLRLEDFIRNNPSCKYNNIVRP